MGEARRVAKRALPRLADFGSSRLATGLTMSARDRVSELLRDATTAQDRATRSLALLCDDRSATHGYLYLVGDAGLTLVASHGSSAPPEGLLEYLHEYFERDVSESGDQTSALIGTQMRTALTARPCFRDGEGTDHHLVLMTSLVDGVARHAGVAVFVEGPRAERPAGGAVLVSELSTLLIQSGDTLGVPA
jgi:hypothetical protein